MHPAERALWMLPRPRSKLEEAIGSLPPRTPLPWREASLCVLGAPAEGLESADPTFLGASCPLLGIALFPSVLSLEPAGRGLTGGWGGPLLGTQTRVRHPGASEQGEPSAELHKVSKNKTAAPPTTLPNTTFLPPAGSC